MWLLGLSTCTVDSKRVSLEVGQIILASGGYVGTFWPLLLEGRWCRDLSSSALSWGETSDRTDGFGSGLRLFVLEFWGSLLRGLWVHNVAGCELSASWTLGVSRASGGSLSSCCRAESFRNFIGFWSWAMPAFEQQLLRSRASCC